MKKRIFALILCASLMTGEMTFWQNPVVKAETVSGSESKDGKVAVKRLQLRIRQVRQALFMQIAVMILEMNQFIS